MSRFYAEMQGNRGPATLKGSADSGMYAHVRGWDVGVEVRCSVDRNGKDVVDVFRTGGSNGGRSYLLATLTPEKDEVATPLEEAESRPMRVIRMG